MHFVVRKKRAHYRKTHVLNVKSIFGLKLHFGAEKRILTEAGRQAEKRPSLPVES